MRTHAEWKVETHMRPASSPTSAAIRSRISAAALFVKVMARIWPALAWPVASKYAMRCVRTRVLPDPAPAMMSSGAPRCSTEARWRSLSPRVNSSGSPAGLAYALCVHSKVPWARAPGPAPEAGAAPGAPPGTAAGGHPSPASSTSKAGASGGA